MEDDSEALFRANEEEEEEYHEEHPDTKELVVYLVDCSSPMFLKAPGKVWDHDVEEEEEDGRAQEPEKTYFEAAMRCVEEDLKARIISRDYDDVSIVFFGTREKKNPMSSEGVYVVQELQQTSAELIRRVRELSRVFDMEIGSRDSSLAQTDRDSPLYNALWAAQSLFALLGTSGRGLPRRVLLFTNTDDPFGDVKSEGLRADLCRTCMQRAKDAASVGISIELFPMSRPGEEFNLAIFYQDIVNMGAHDPSDFMMHARGRFEDLVAQMRKRTMRKRMVRRLFLSIAAGPPEEGEGAGGTHHIALRAYALLRPSKIARSIFLRAQDNAPVTVETAQVCQDTGAVVQPKSMKKLQALGSGTSAAQVLLTQEQLRALRPLPLSSLQILGFKPLQALQDYHNLRPSTFLYPEEQAAHGSVPAFIALHRAMLKLERFALAVSSESGAPRLVALLPQDEVRDDAGAQVQPPGWSMVPLPFQEDIRPLKEALAQAVASARMERTGDKGHENEEEDNDDEDMAPPQHQATEGQIAKAAGVLRKMQLKDFSLLDIQNPVIQTHYAMLEAIALDEEEMPRMVDSTLPNAKALSRPGIVQASRAFKDSVYGEGFDEREAAREAAEREKSEAAMRKRRIMADAAAARVQEIDWRTLADKGQLDRLTVEDLKSYLRAHSLSLSGKKMELVRRVLEHLETP